MPNIYIALLRGINVGGKQKLSMSELKEALTANGLEDVKTYINSGNIIFKSKEKDKTKLASKIENLIKKKFNLIVPAVVVSGAELKTIINNVPKGWGSDDGWKYNLLFVKQPYKSAQVVKDIGELKPGIETVVAGKGVVYQTMLFEKFGKTTTGKLASMPVYKQITIRNHRTGAKLAAMVEEL